MNSVDSWKGPHTETGKAVARRRSRPCHRLSSLARPPSLSGGGAALSFQRVPPGPLPLFAHVTLLLISSKARTALPPPPQAVTRSPAVPLAVGIVQGPRPTTPTVFAGPEPANWSPFSNVHRIPLLGPAFCG